MIAPADTLTPSNAAHSLHIAEPRPDAKRKPPEPPVDRPDSKRTEAPSLPSSRSATQLRTLPRRLIKRRAGSTIGGRNDRHGDELAGFELIRVSSAPPSPAPCAATLSEQEDLLLQELRDDPSCCLKAPQPPAKCPQAPSQASQDGAEEKRSYDVYLETLRMSAAAGDAVALELVCMLDTLV